MFAVVINGGLKLIWWVTTPKDRSCRSQHPIGLVVVGRKRFTHLCSLSTVAFEQIIGTLLFTDGQQSRDAVGTVSSALFRRAVLDKRSSPFPPPAAERRKKIAHRFIGGFRRCNSQVPGGTAEISAEPSRWLWGARPPGALPIQLPIPPNNRLARLFPATHTFHHNLSL